MGVFMFFVSLINIICREKWFYIFRSFLFVKGMRIFLQKRMIVSACLCETQRWSNWVESFLKRNIYSGIPFLFSVTGWLINSNLFCCRRVTFFFFKYNFRLWRRNIFLLRGRRLIIEKTPWTRHFGGILVFWRVW